MYCILQLLHENHEMLIKNLHFALSFKRSADFSFSCDFVANKINLVELYE